MTNFTREGHVLVEFSHDIAYRDDLKNIVDLGLIDVFVTLIRKDETYVARGIPDQAEQLNYDELVLEEGTDAE